jgi:hypothetical protein
MFKMALSESSDMTPMARKPNDAAPQQPKQEPDCRQRHRKRRRPGLKPAQISGCFPHDVDRPLQG